MAKKNRPEELKKNNAPLNGAMKFFVGGCVAEVYLLAVRRYYVNGTAQQLIAWDDILRYLMYAGLGLLVLGVILIALWRKAEAWKQIAAWSAGTVGAFLAVGNWIIRHVFPNGVMILCILVAAMMLLGVLWCMYARECFFAMLILSSGLFATWVCRHGMDSPYWRTRVLIGACLYLAAMAVVALTARQLERNKGMLGTVRVLPKNASCTVLFLTTGLSAAATAVSILSATAAYYALWVLAIVVFILAVYYTVKEL